MQFMPEMDTTMMDIDCGWSFPREVEEVSAEDDLEEAADLQPGEVSTG